MAGMFADIGKPKGTVTRTASTPTPAPTTSVSPTVQSTSPTPTPSASHVRRVRIAIDTRTDTRTALKAAARKEGLSLRDYLLLLARRAGVTITDLPVSLI